MTEAQNAIDPFYGEFAALADEDLVHAEQAAIRLERMHRDPAVAATLQRRLHAIEGTCSAVGFPHMVALVNRARRMLALVESDPARTFDRRHGDALLAVVDALRGSLRSVRATGLEPEAPLVLMERLRALGSEAPGHAEERHARLLCWGHGADEVVGGWVARTAQRLQHDGIGGVVVRGPDAALWRLDGSRSAIHLELSRFARGTLGVALEVGLFVDIERAHRARPGVREVRVRHLPDLRTVSGWELVDWVDEVTTAAP